MPSSLPFVLRYILEEIFQKTDIDSYLRTHMECTECFPLVYCQGERMSQSHVPQVIGVIGGICINILLYGTGCMCRYQLTLAQEDVFVCSSSTSNC